MNSTAGETSPIGISSVHALPFFARHSAAADTRFRSFKGFIVLEGDSIVTFFAMGIDPDGG